MPCLGVTGCESSIVPDPYLTTGGRQRGSMGLTDLGVVCKRLTLIRDYRWVKSHRYHMSNMVMRSTVQSIPAQHSITLWLLLKVQLAM